MGYKPSVFEIAKFDYKFFKKIKKFKRMSLGSKYCEINDFYKLLNAVINTHEATTTETKDGKNRIVNYLKQLYNKYLDTYKENCDNEKVKDEEQNRAWL